MMTESEFKKLPKSQREAIQQRLKDQGIYVGKIDSNWGGGTEAALKQEEQRRVEGEERSRKDSLEQQRIENERLRLETEKGKVSTDNAATEAKTAREKLHQEQAGSAEGIATQSAAWLASPAATGALGYYAGGKLNERLNEGQEGRNVKLRGAAADRLRGLTTRDGAVKGVTLAGAMPFSNAPMRAAARMAPHAGLGGLSIGKGASLLAGGDEDQPFYSRMGDVAAGTGYIGFGSGLLKRGIEQAASPKVSPDAQALSIINSNQLRRGNSGSKLADALTKGQIIDAEVIPEGQKAPASPNAPEPKPLSPGTAAYMRQQLKDLGVKGTSKMLKGDLAQALAQQMEEHGAKRTVGKKITKGAGKTAIPAAVGSYLAATGDSEAADATTGERATNAAGNFAAGAGGAYAGSKLVDALRSAAPTAMRALGGGLSMMAPGAAADITDGLAQPPVPDEQELMARNQEVASMPFLRHLTPGHAEAHDVAQVPQANPERRSMGPRMDDPRLQGKIRRMSQTGATPEQIANFLNGAFAQ